MKKLLALMLFVCIMMPAVLAETVITELEKPSMTLNESLYEFLMEETDGSEELIYMMLDWMNDELSEIEEYGAIKGDVYARLTDDSFIRVYQCVQDSEYGIILIGGLDEPYSFYYYCCGKYRYTVTNGEYTGKEINSFDNDEFADAFHFPYEGPLNTLRGMRQDDEGNTYYLVKSGADRMFEYVSGDGMKIKRISIYGLDEDGSWGLAMYVDYNTGEADEIPQVVLNQIAKDNEPKTQTEGQKG